MSIATPRRGFERAGGSSSSIVPDRLVGFWYRDDYTNSFMSSFAVNGTGTNSRTATSVQGRPGINLASVSAAATPDRASSAMNNASTHPSGGGVITVETELKLTALSNGTDNIVVRFGMAASGSITSQADFTVGVYLEYDFAAHGSHNWFLCSASGGVRTKTDTGIAATNQWTRLQVVLAADSSSVTAKINGTALAATNNTNMPALNTSMDFGWQVTKQLGAGLTSCAFDYVEVMQTFSSSR